jgi:hypothetical protein
MSDTYQAVYDAVRSRISNGDVGSAVADVIRQSFDISNAVFNLSQNFHGSADSITAAANQHARPSAVFKPKLGRDGNQWCFLLGDNLQEGVVGFGDTPEKAAVAFDLAFLNERS